MEKLTDPVSLDEVLSAWDRLSAAIDRTVTALPAQMTDAAAELEQARWQMRSVMNRYGFQAGSPPLNRSQ